MPKSRNEAKLATKYDLRVPRYTSYPTAPHFTEAVDGGVYRGWLGDLDADNPLSLYFHIPFCDEMCWFCGCYTKVVKRYQPVADYLDTLLAEVDLVADALPGRFRASHLHWGGGSPTMLTGPDWLRTLEKLRSRFDIGADAEIAVEMDPRTATEDYVGALARAGVNRASIGVQDFHPEVQAAINRIQPFDMTERVIGWLRSNGIEHINMDLMYGLPHQTTERVTDMVDLAVKLSPNRIALFGYAHVPWMKSHQKMIHEDTLPGGEDRWNQFEAASKRLEENGYVKVGLDHFARPDDDLAVALKEGHMHRNFQGYTTDASSVLLGFGASAIGHLPQGYTQNLSPLKGWRTAIENGVLPTARGVALSEDDRRRAAIIERLMCDLRVDLGEMGGAGAYRAEVEKLMPLVEDGLVTVDGERITITEAGRPFIRLAAAAFDAYLGEGEGRKEGGQPARHSRAV